MPNSLDGFKNNCELVRSFTPTITPAAPMTFGAGPSNVLGEWFVIGNELFGAVSFNSTTATAGSPFMVFPLPVTTIQNPDLTVIGHGVFTDFIIQPITLNVIRDGLNARIVRYDGGNFALIANQISVHFRYRIKDA